MRNLQIEKRFVCRIAGEPVSRLAVLGSPKLGQLLDAYLTLQRVGNECRAQASDLLFALVSQASSETRQPLIRLRRAIHNSREVTDRDWLVCAASMEGQHVALLERSKVIRLQLHTMEAEIRSVHEQEWDRVANEIWRQIASGDVSRGLCLSSSALAEHAVRGIRDDTRGARRAQVERGLLRYMTRAAAKPTPFSTFCTVIAGQLEPTGEGTASAAIHGDLTKQSAMRLNRAIFPVLWAELIQVREFRDSMPVCTTPSFRLVGSEYQYVCESAGVEITRKLEANRALDSIVRKIESTDRIQFQSLVAEIARMSDEEDGRENATAYLSRLIELGMLQFWHGIEPLDPDWDLKLVDLMSVPNPVVIAVQEKLKRLRTSMHRYNQLGAGDRLDLVRQTQDDIAAIFELFEKKVRVPNNLPFYEDCGASADCEVRTEFGGEGFVGTLERLQSILRNLSTQWDEQATLRAVYHKCYGEGSASIPLLQFYEDSFREFYKAHFSLERTGIREEKDKGYNFGNPLAVASIARRVEKRAALVAFLRRRIDELDFGSNLNLTAAELEQIIDLDLPDPITASISAFGHILDCPGEPQRFVLPEAKVLLGFGKYFSRFLHVMPWEFTNSVRETNARYGSLFSEISDESDFNANLHPPLFDSEIIYPSKAAASSVSSRHDCSGLFVSPSEAFEGLLIRLGEEGPPLVPLDLGFQNPTLRPAFHRLLQKFQPACTTWLPVEQAIQGLTHERWSQLRRSDPTASLPIAQTPRITIDERVVVARKRWRVPPCQFPSVKSGETGSHYFLRLQQWRHLHGIPCRVFAKVLPGLIPAPPKNPDVVTVGDKVPLGSKNKVRDNRKPQFIDFTSPQLSDLFSRLRLDGQHLDVMVEEALPDFEHAWKYESDSYLTEVVLQLNTADAVPSPNPDRAASEIELARV